MNKVDTWGVIASLLLVWIFAVFLLPSNIMTFIYQMIAAFAVGNFIGKAPWMLSGETNRHYLKKMFKLSDEQNQTIREMYECLEIAESANHSLMAKIDQLMLEYCPEEMTPEQIANYEAHQRPATKEEEDAVK